jgi:hypothetical protein
MDHPDGLITSRATNARTHASYSPSTSHQYLFANAVEIEPIEKDLLAEIIEAQGTDQTSYGFAAKIGWY